MLPEHGSEKFKCPHCDTVATQEWFNAFEASHTAVDIINHLYLNYRSSTDEIGQRRITNFLSVTDEDLRKSIYHTIPEKLSVATCSSCNNFTLWVNKEIVYPKKTTVPPPNEDLDENIKVLYIEASTILVDSPKGSTALLRLALQMLLKQIGKSGKNINNDIKDLVADGLSPTVQKALDLLRVIRPLAKVVVRHNVYY